MKGNYVAKHARTYNKAKVEEDRKKNMKKGYQKHRGESKDSSFFVYIL